MKPTKHFLRKLKMIGIWLLVWQMLSVLVDNTILLAGPMEVGRRLLFDCVTTEFWKTCLLSTIRISIGFLGGVTGGIAAAALCYRFRLVRELVEPIVHVMQAVPVASFVVILLIWFGSGSLSALISFLVVFPNLYFQSMKGLENRDGKLWELAQVYGMNRWNRFWYLYRPAMAPFLLGAAKVSVGFAWKSGVAAEIIGLPELTLGEQIYSSKIYLDTAGVFSWTIVVIGLSALTGHLFQKLLHKALYMTVPVRGMESRDSEDKAENREKNAIQVTGLSKSFENRNLFENVSITLEHGKCYAFVEPSGIGKTTFLRIFAGLEKAEKGRIQGIPEHIGMVFQENRLLETENLFTNMRLIGAGIGEDDKTISEKTGNVLPKEIFEQKTASYSGGMKRRAEVIRCMLSKAELVLLDEPFNGISEEQKIELAEFIKKYQKNRILLMTAHREEDAKLLDAVIVRNKNASIFNTSML